MKISEDWKKSIIFDGEGSLVLSKSDCAFTINNKTVKVEVQNWNIQGLNNLSFRQKLRVLKRCYKFIFK